MGSDESHRSVTRSHCDRGRRWDLRRHRHTRSPRGRRNRRAIGHKPDRRPCTHPSRGLRRGKPTGGLAEQRRTRRNLHTGSPRRIAVNPLPNARRTNPHRRIPTGWRGRGALCIRDFPDGVAASPGTRRTDSNDPPVAAAHCSPPGPGLPPSGQSSTCSTRSVRRAVRRRWRGLASWRSAHSAIATQWRVRACSPISCRAS